MYRVFKVCVLMFVSMAHLFSFGMNRAHKLPIQPRDIVRMTPQALRGQGMGRVLATERARRHFDRLAEDSNKTKFLEHPTFRGESLNFQNRFFSSNYMDLPNDVAHPIVLMTQETSVDPRRFVFAYHAHYRKKCENLIDAFDNAARKKAELYDRQAQKLFWQADGIERIRDLEITMRKDMRCRGIVTSNMIRAFTNNHYPLVLAVHQKYCDMPK